MKVSVLTPIYRTNERHLREAIESVLAQTFADFELLLLDDCPEDDREEIVRSYRDPRIVYLKNERNLGISASRNKLIDLAKGEYLAIFDHDDVCRPERLAHEVAWLDAHPSCGVVGGWTRQSDNGSVTRYPEDDSAIKVEMMWGASVWHPAAMVRKSVLSESGIRYRAAYSPVEDYMLRLELVKRTEFHNLPELVIDYRRHETNTSVVRKAELEVSEVACRAWAKVNLPELYAAYEFRRETVCRYRLLGVPVLKTVSTARETVALLFDRIPVARVSRRFRF